MRGSTLLVAVWLLGCPAGEGLTAGAPCASENVGRCDSDAPRLLQCIAGEYRVYADCKGAKGCRLENDTAECDTSGNSLGDRCAPTSEGKVRCEPDAGLDILRCVDGGLVLEFSCPAGRICGFSDAGLTCI